MAKVINTEVELAKIKAKTSKRRMKYKDKQHRRDTTRQMNETKYAYKTSRKEASKITAKGHAVAESIAATTPHALAVSNAISNSGSGQKYSGSAFNALVDNAATNSITGDTYNEGYNGDGSITEYEEGKLS